MSILPLPNNMLDAVLDNLAARELPTSLLCDHVCYRVATEQRYTQLRTALETEGTLVSEALVGGRPISVFRLFTPYEHRGLVIEALELPAPKQDVAYPEGWEHAEFVVGVSLEEFLRMYPAETFDTKAINKPLNPEIALKCHGYRAKFHTLPLLEIIELESLR